jgi:diguanylate cyclase (GGDEF)-like protein/putative nucleotidyltransferase with HDIG domain
MAVFAHSLRQIYLVPVSSQWFVLAVLTLLTGSFTIGMSSLPARVSVSETFVFASVLLFGPSAGTITVVLESLIMSFWLSKDTRAPSRLLFNAAATALAIWLSATAYYSFSGVKPHLDSATPIYFLPLAVFTILYFLLNTWLVAFAVALHNDRSPLNVWWPHFPWLSINYFSGASLAALIVTYTKSIDFSTLLIFIPLLVITYFTFRTVMGRFDDSTKHLEELNRLYLSTIETLAMAIDAKDQITHGHIRRVQAYAVGLARHVGVKDERLIKAVEAAALLHDMGKLAVPEYILNKPGRLTEAEFEKMKLHASVGADILSAIDFPYPVVPIVRHHHEYWDGGGYPDGLRSTDIPIGARILSVVDCFDALTSDRPYRPRLSDEEAIAILLQRRGSMYDPLIVDKFIEVLNELAPDPAIETVHRAGLTQIAGATHDALAVLTKSSPQFDAIAASRDEDSTIHTLATALSAAKTIAEAGDIVAKDVLRLVPFSLMVLYTYDSKTDEIEAKYVAGEVQVPIRNMRINLGTRLSGWVAANRQTVVNSDPVLDLGELARSSTPKLRSCLSTPITANSTLVGVLSLYSSNSEQFSEEHKRIIEAVAQHAALTIRRSLTSDESASHDPITGLRYLSAVLNDERSSDYQAQVRDGSPTVWIDIVGLKHINETFGRAAGNAALLHVARCLRSELNSGDLLFRYKSDEFVAILKSSDSSSRASLSARIKARLEAATAIPDLPTTRLEVVVRNVNKTSDLRQLENLLNQSDDAKIATRRFQIH